MIDGVFDWFNQNVNWTQCVIGWITVFVYSFLVTLEDKLGPRWLTRELERIETDRRMQGTANDGSRWDIWLEPLDTQLKRWRSRT